MSANGNNNRWRLVSSPNAVVAVTIVFALTLMLLFFGYLYLLTDETAATPVTAVTASPQATSGSALASVPALRLEPTQGSPASITVYGTGWPAGSQVSLFLQDLSGDFESSVLVTATASEIGTFQVSLSPPGDLWRRLSGFRVQAVTAAGLAASAFFVVRVEPTPTVAPSPAATEPPAATMSATPTAVPPQPSATPTLVSSSTPPPATAPPATPLSTPTAPPTPTMPPTPTATAVVVVDTGWSGRYFDNSNWAGSPVETGASDDLLFDWGAGAPAGLTPDAFSARWTRTLPLPAGSYRFHLRAAAETRVWLDDILLFTVPAGERAVAESITLGLTAATYQFQVEFGDQPGGMAHLQFWWEYVDEQDPDEPWLAEYWSNGNLVGKPLLTRTEASVCHDWGAGRPDTRLNADNFSGRWRRTVDVAAGVYQFDLTFDDGARLLLDGVTILDDWEPGVRRSATAQVWLDEGPHLLEVQFFEGAGDAFIQMGWGAADVTFAGWRAEYFANRTLTGRSWLVDDPNVDHDWGAGSPLPELGADGFSARWTQTDTFAAGTYRFSLQSDDGARVYVDGRLVLDAWGPGVFGPVQTVEVELDGNHTIVVEYYEDTATAAVRLVITPL